MINTWTKDWLTLPSAQMQGHMYLGIAFSSALSHFEGVRYAQQKTDDRRNTINNLPDFANKGLHRVNKRFENYASAKRRISRIARVKKYPY